MDRYYKGLDKTKLDRRLARIELAKIHNNRLQALIDQRESEEKEIQRLKDLANDLRNDMEFIANSSALMGKKKKSKKKKKKKSRPIPKYQQISNHIIEEEEIEDEEHIDDYRNRRKLGERNRLSTSLSQSKKSFGSDL